LLIALILTQNAETANDAVTKCSAKIFYFYYMKYAPQPPDRQERQPAYEHAYREAKPIGMAKVRGFAAKIEFTEARVTRSAGRCSTGLSPSDTRGR